jgi:hypothetical protein
MFCACALLFSWAVWPSSAQADVDLDLRVVELAYGPGYAEADLWAVCDSPVPQAIGGMSVILVWDPEVLEGVSINSLEGPYDWVNEDGNPLEGFYDDSAMDGLNETFLDGDALYMNFVDFGVDLYVDQDGLWVGRFTFEKKRCYGPAMLTIVPELGAYSHTVVYDGIHPGGQVTGDLDEVDLMPPPIPGDMNCDGFVNNFDIKPFVLAVSDPEAYAEHYPCCDIMFGDLTGDGLVNNFDIKPFLELLR